MMIIDAEDSTILKIMIPKNKYDNHFSSSLLTNDKKNGVIVVDSYF